MLISRSRQRPTKSGDSSRMKPARQTNSMPAPSSCRVRAASKAALREGLGVEHHGRDAGVGRARQAGGVGPVGRRPARSRPESRRPAAAGSAPPCWSRGPKSAHRRACALEPPPVERAVETPARPSRASIRADCRRPSRPRGSAAAIAARRRRRTTTTMPTPQLKVRIISSLGDAAELGQPANTGGTASAVSRCARRVMPAARAARSR